MRAAIRDDDPVLFFEDRMLYTQRGPVEDAAARPSLGEMRIVRPGRDLTIVAIGRMVLLAEQAAAILARKGIEAEVIDPRTLAPLDLAGIVASVKRTNRAMVVDGAPLLYGVTGEIAASIGEQAFDWLDAPVARLAAADVPVPISRSLEPLVRPDAAAIVAAAESLLR
jgi:pyruvate/2-oxoglutarate/acetoin dehydrogenase E1 component